MNRKQCGVPEETRTKDFLHKWVLANGCHFERGLPIEEFFIMCSPFGRFFSRLGSLRMTMAITSALRQEV